MPRCITLNWAWLVSPSKPNSRSWSIISRSMLRTIKYCLLLDKAYRFVESFTGVRDPNRWLESRHGKNPIRFRWWISSAGSRSVADQPQLASQTFGCRFAIMPWISRQTNRYQAILRSNRVTTNHGLHVCGSCITLLPLRHHDYQIPLMLINDIVITARLGTIRPPTSKRGWQPPALLDANQPTTVKLSHPPSRY
jgi:hypothetical protein